MMPISQDDVDLKDSNNHQEATISPYMGVGNPSDITSPQKALTATGVLQAVQSLTQTMQHTIHMFSTQISTQNGQIAEQMNLIACVQREQLRLHKNQERLTGGHRELRRRQSRVEKQTLRTSIAVAQIQRQLAKLKAYEKRRDLQRIHNAGQVGVSGASRINNGNNNSKP